MAKKTKTLPTEAVQSMPTKSDDSWQHESNARTVMEAHEILADPVKMKGVTKHLKKKKQAMRSIDDVIKYRNQKYGPKSSQETEHTTEE